MEYVDVFVFGVCCLLASSQSWDSSHPRVVYWRLRRFSLQIREFATNLPDTLYSIVDFVYSPSNRDSWLFFCRVVAHLVPSRPFHISQVECDITYFPPPSFHHLADARCWASGLLILLLKDPRGNVERSRWESITWSIYLDHASSLGNPRTQSGLASRI